MSERPAAPGEPARGSAGQRRSTPGPGSSAPVAPAASGRVVISSVTGKPIPWEAEEAAPRGTSAHDAELLRNLPPHWGR
ncbi:hypothetical protein Bequi_05690 [Brachybacterium sp. JHP9]|uniref:Uncharacterized protein n=1 Tax=Brachybacterium equifaecis TaxID=2910770 RepID=A0ABT0R092_9MICO|nr:hypothetical protein [Brachybacterium equifaecis]MCL6422883.1 hypothetical protein [Brachybacterium equifaecis]